MSLPITSAHLLSSREQASGGISTAVVVKKRAMQKKSAHACIGFVVLIMANRFYKQVCNCARISRQLLEILGLHSKIEVHHSLTAQTCHYCLTAAFLVQSSSEAFGSHASTKSGEEELRGRSTQRVHVAGESWLFGPVNLPRMIRSEAQGPTTPF